MDFVKNLKNLSVDERRNFLDSFDEVFCDCDGVIWYTTDVIKGAAHAVQKLRDAGKKVRFISNNCIYTYELFHERLEKCKFGSEKDSFVFPTMAMIDYLKSVNFNKEIFMLASLSMRSEIKRAGFKLAANGPDKITATVSGLKAELKDNSNVGAVIVDIDVNVNYINIMLAALYLKRNDVLLLMGAEDKILPFSEETRVIGPYYFQKMIADITNVEPLYFAKPGHLMSDFINKKYQINNPKRVLFIGDQLEQDIKFAEANGFQKLLVLTGTTRKEKLEKNDFADEQKPDYYLDSIASLVDIIDSVKK
ncbi:unnamed protein product [Brassicogethes aeneus]|uniref:4-nitrophenylphosphatase n=1 Tax=Brassicogethes aeneus TaxID=1431903 RepID=A0A9P0FMP5_BRAAE|nr:unnamed protein product [Brassicogethes aeneus]